MRGLLRMQLIMENGERFDFEEVIDVDEEE